MVSRWSPRGRFSPKIQHENTPPGKHNQRRERLTSQAAAGGLNAATLSPLWLTARLLAPLKLASTCEKLVLLGE